jgi:hypothetical protein
MSAARVVRATEINRVLDVLAARGEKPTTYDLLPGGLVRLHLTPPAANDSASDLEAEARAWDAALGE